LSSVKVFKGTVTVEKTHKEKIQQNKNQENSMISRSNHGATAPKVVPTGLLWLGQVGRPHGIKGGFFLKTQDNRNEWPGYHSVYVGAESAKAVAVQKAYVSGGKLALQLENISSREQVEGLYNTHVFVSRDQVELGDSEYLVVDIVGSQVEIEGRTGVFGEVISVHDFGAQETLEIRLKDVTRGTIFYPFTEQFVLEFNPAKRTILLKDEPVFLDEGK
jgi:16S rRNA processing protein RimM